MESFSGVLGYFEALGAGCLRLLLLLFLLLLLWGGGGGGGGGGGVGVKGFAVLEFRVQGCFGLKASSSAAQLPTKKTKHPKQPEILNLKRHP